MDRLRNLTGASVVPYHPISTSISQPLLLDGSVSVDLKNLDERTSAIGRYAISIDDINDRYRRICPRSSRVRGCVYLSSFVFSVSACASCWIAMYVKATMINIGILSVAGGTTVSTVGGMVINNECIEPRQRDCYLLIIEGLKTCNDPNFMNYLEENFKQKNITRISERGFVRLVQQWQSQGGITNGSS